MTSTFKGGQLVEFYSDGLRPIVSADSTQPASQTFLIKSGDIGLLIEPPVNKYCLAKVLVRESMVYVRSYEIRIHFENGYLEMIKRAEVSDDEKE